MMGRINAWELMDIFFVPIRPTLPRSLALLTSAVFLVVAFTLGVLSRHHLGMVLSSWVGSTSMSPVPT